MAERLSRKALYDLVWSEPIKTLAARFGVSDVTLKNKCARADIPTPDRGYWAQKDAGKKVVQPALPARSAGMGDEVVIGDKEHDSYYYPHWNDKEVLLGPLPSPPEFPEPIETVRERIVATIGRVTVPHTVRSWHPVIERLLKEDEKRREKQLTSTYTLPWNEPVFDTPFERRRLRILNSLFFAVAKMRGRQAVCGHEAREIRISVFQQHLHLTLDRPKGSVRRGQAFDTPPESPDTRLSLSIFESFGSEKAAATWQDDDAQKLEAHVAEIAVQIILTAEIQYRESALRQYQWRVQRKAELEAEERQRKIEAERAEKERQKRIEQARIDRLLNDAAAFQKANEIRKYVEAIISAQKLGTSPLTVEVEQWSHWALAQADLLDPAVGGAFLMAMQDK